MTQPRSPSMLANVTWTFVANSFYAACQWAMLAGVAKLGTPSMVGQFALAQAIAIPIYSFTNLQLRALQVTDAADRYPTGAYLGLRHASLVPALALIVGVAVFGGYRAATAWVLVVFGVAKAIEASSDILHGILQKHERMDRIALSLSLKGLLALGAMLGAVALTRSVVVGVAAMTAAWTAVLLVYDVPTAARMVLSGPLGERAARPLKPIWNWTSLRRLFWHAAPLALSYLLVMLSPSIPRYMIERSHGESELGIFAALFHLTLIGYQVVAAVGQATSARIARLHANGDAAALRRWVMRLIGVGAGLGVVAIAIAATAGREVLTLVYRAEYGARSHVFLLLTIGSAFFWISTGLGFAVTAMQAFRIHLLPHGVNVIFTAGASLLAIPRGGLVAAAWIQLATSAFFAVAYVWIALHMVKRVQADRSIAQPFTSSLSAEPVPGGER